MRAYFGRKMPDVETLQAATLRATQRRFPGSAYTVTKEIELGDKEFKEFAEDLLEDQPWIGNEDGGMTSAGEIRCIRVRNAQTGERVLVNSEGYDYPRYTAIEE